MYANQQLVTQHMVDSSTLYATRVLLVETEDEMLRLESMVKQLNIRKPVAAVRTTITTRIHDTIYVAEPVLVDSVPHLKLPAKIEKHQKWYSFEGTLTESGYLSIDTMAVNAELTWAIGDTLRDGFWNKALRRKDKVVRLRIDNPYVECTGMEAVIEPPKKRKVWPWIAATGIGALILIKF